MNADRLLAHYDRIAEAPDAVARLRRLTLDLAVRGKLVPQAPEDEPASELLTQIAAEKARLVQAGGARKSEIDPVTTDEVPFLLPDSWAWTRLGSIGDWGSGSTPPRGNIDFYGGGITWLKSGELNDSRHLEGSAETVSELALDKGSFRLNRPGDVLIAMYGATIGKVAILAEDAVTNQAVCGCTPFSGVFNQFLFLFLLSQREQFHSASEGGAQPNISKEKIVWTPFPLPPLAEQHRIVAKVDELMTLCDRLEAMRTEREAIRDRLVNATFARLHLPDPDTFPNSVRFALENIVAITTRTDQIKQLRQTILNLAIRGKLVAQDPKDEPASELLKRIAAEKARLVKAGEIRRPKSLPPVQLEDISVAAIPGWVWVRLGEVSTLVTKGSTPTSYGHAYTSKGVNFIKVESIKNGQLLPENVRSFISNETHDFLARSRLSAGDILFSIAGSIGTCAVVTDQVLPANTNQALAIIRGTQTVFRPDFLLKSLQSSIAEPVFAKARGGAMNNVSLEVIQNFVVPVPPFAEQCRITAKIDELMALCDLLEERLTEAVGTKSRLFGAIVSVATSGA